jgi:hypothetical protein
MAARELQVKAPVTKNAEELAAPGATPISFHSVLLEPPLGSSESLWNWRLYAERMRSVCGLYGPVSVEKCYGLAANTKAKLTAGSGSKR